MRGSSAAPRHVMRDLRVDQLAERVDALDTCTRTLENVADAGTIPHECVRIIVRRERHQTIPREKDYDDDRECLFHFGSSATMFFKP